MILQPNPKLPWQFLPPSHERVCRLGASVANQMSVHVLPVKILLHPAAPYRAKHTTPHNPYPFFSGPEKKEAKTSVCKWQGMLAILSRRLLTQPGHKVNIQPPAPWFRSWSPHGRTLSAQKFGWIGGVLFAPTVSSFWFPFIMSEGGWLRDLIATRWYHLLGSSLLGSWIKEMRRRAASQQFLCAIAAHCVRHVDSIHHWLHMTTTNSQ